MQRFAPKLMRSLERAIAFCQSTLSYGQVREAPPDRKPVRLEGLVEDVRETLGISAESRGALDHVGRARTAWSTPTPSSSSVSSSISRATRCRRSKAARRTSRAAISCASPAGAKATVVAIEVSDTGPGVPERARAHLFEAFQGSTRRGGSGLGLAIAAELVRAHGGEIRLVEGTIGATFRLIIPDRAVDIGARRGERARA